MRKISLLFVLLLAVSFVMAQSNVSVIDQETVGATTNYAKVNQDGKMNTSDIDQDATFRSADIENKTIVDQKGKSNSVDVDQNFETFGGSPINKVVVDQDGEGNEANVESQSYWGHDIYVKQDGKTNVANVDVKRNGNTVKVMQKGGNKGGEVNVLVNSFGSKTTAIQEDGMDQVANQMMGEYDVIGGGNEMYIKQLRGKRNEANQYLLNSVHGKGNDNYQKIEQVDGMDNVAIQRVGEWVGRPVETSDNNEAYTKQEGGSDNSALIEQIKNGQYAKQTQIGGVGNKATIKQTNGWAAPDGAESYQMQKGAGGNEAIANVFNGKGVSDQYQDGKDNYSRIAQAGSENFIITKQWGKENSAFAQTTGGSLNDINVKQDGEGNWATVVAARGNNNEAVVNQDGKGNKVGEGNWNTNGIYQVDGSNNYASAKQTGDLNDASIFQTGDNNFGTITSTGNGHIGSIMQAGGMNEAIVTQSN